MPGVEHALHSFVGVRDPLQEHSRAANLLTIKHEVARDSTPKAVMGAPRAMEMSKACMYMYILIYMLIFYCYLKGSISTFGDKILLPISNKEKKPFYAFSCDQIK